MEVLSQRIVLTFYTDDFDEVIAFYSKVGFIVADDKIMGGGERWLVLAKADNPTIQLHFHPTSSLVPVGHVQPIAFELSNPDIATLAARLRTDDIAFSEWEVPWACSISIQDPLGNTVTLSNWHSVAAS